MEKTIRLLAALLGVQLLLAVGLGVIRTDLSAPAEDAPLLAFKKDEVDRLTLEGSDKSRLVLAKIDGQWRLPDSEGFPADRDKVEQLLSRLEGFKQGLPVATSVSARERFKVHDTAFERRITLAGGDETLAILYLGSSPSVRRIHARAGDDAQIHSVQFAAYEVPLKPEDWEDKTVLAIARAEIAAIEVGGLRLERAAAAATNTDAATNADGNAAPAGEQNDAAKKAWRASGLPKGMNVDADAADRLVQQLEQLRIDKALGRDEKPDYGLKQPALALSVARRGGEPIEYRLGKAPDKDEYTIKASTRPEYFRLPSYAATQLINAAGTKSLLRPAAAAQGSDPAGGK